MHNENREWYAEIDRRAAVYDALERSGQWEGRLTTADCLAAVALAVLLTVGFWTWAV